jgi:hypothetical protein
VKPQKVAAEVHKPEALRHQNARGAHADEEGTFQPHASHRENEGRITEPQEIGGSVGAQINRDEDGEENGAGQFGGQRDFA